MPDPDKRTAAHYARQYLALLPEGPFWEGFRQPDGRNRRLIDAKAEGMARVDGRGLDLVRDLNPLTAFETLAARETEAGLPHACAGLPETIAARVDALVAQWSARGGQSRQYYINVAAALGYVITITEYGARQHGRADYGGTYGGPDWWFVWQVDAALYNYRAREFGRAAHGEPYASWGNAVLECVLERLKPAHTLIIFSYT